MLFLEAAVTGWPAGLQKIGVRTRGPVTAVPITAPPCQISGGVPLAVSPAVGDWRLSAGHRVWTSRALTMPAKRPMRGPWPFLAQAPGACDEVLGTASAAVLVASRVAVPSATTVRVARRARRLNALAIRVLRSVPGAARAVGGSPERGARLDIPFRGRLVVSTSSAIEVLVAACAGGLNQNFCWYQLPVKWFAELDEKLRVTAALAQALDLLQLPRYAAISLWCRHAALFR